MREADTFAVEDLPEQDETSTLLAVSVIAILLARADGNMRPSEFMTIGHWLRRHSSLDPMEIENVLRVAVHLADERRSVDEAIEILSEDFTYSQWYMTRQMLEGMAAADGRFSLAEARFCRLLRKAM